MKIDIKKVQQGIQQAFEKHWLESIYLMTAFKTSSPQKKETHPSRKSPTKVAKTVEKR